MLQSNNVQPLKSFVATDNYGYCNTFSPVNLPTSKPATPQLSHTITTANLPTFSSSPASFKYMESSAVWGRNTDATAKSVSYEVYKNSTLITSGTYSVGVLYYYTIQAIFALVDTVVGDVLDIYAWATDGTITIEGVCAFVTFQELQLEDSKYLLDLKLDNFTLSNPLLESLVPNKSYTAEQYTLWDVTKINDYFNTAWTKKILYSNPKTITSYYNYPGSTSMDKCALRSSVSVRPYLLVHKFPRTITYKTFLADSKL